jgi:bisphosphoglycerate-independent phosphoglycerate mutase (AlkP superfamily)
MILQPQMSAFELTEALVPELERRSRFCLSQLCQRRYGGNTGIMSAAIQV